ncbi:MAG TPA: flagellar basal body P-ring formation chaperone FlgA [Acidisoma sp.]|uniref:flagellar basal body P-ring formation chaperone FlgA n=1 Tax=Acidisoma sp. TaxID=1872115 RepID=UPI002C1FCAD0|nr:flagellar basal body P-ring formation chaperone FlgA [Acidisoma sp.]HTI00224.1 flagellar basal body P-ring formation chaperone FlgA [Acidisoma sp.]
MNAPGVARLLRPCLGRRGLVLVLGLMAMQAPEPALAAKQDPAAVADAVRRAVAATVPANADIILGRVSGAQHMDACTQPLNVTVTGQEPYLQAAAACPAPAWRLYVSVTVDAKMAVVVVARPIPAGQSIQDADLALREEPLSLYAGRRVFYQPGEVTGSIAILTLSPGTIVTGSAVQRPFIVQAGQIIMVDVINGAVDLTLDARADQAGRLGDRIMVTNLSSGRHFQAALTASGAVVQLGR